jgi:amidase
VLPIAESLDHVGPITRRVADVAIMFDAIAGRDPNGSDVTGLRQPRTPSGLSAKAFEACVSASIATTF